MVRFIVMVWVEVMVILGLFFVSMIALVLRLVLDLGLALVQF